MLRKIVLAFLLIFSINFVYSADVEVSAYVYSDSTIFNYILKFNENDTVNKFSVEKPKDAQLSYIVNENGPIEYDEAGDYYIFKPEAIEDDVFLLKYESKMLSEEIFVTDSFRTYINFNFPVDNLEFNLYLKDDFGEVIDLFPRDFDLKDNKYTWSLSNVSKESLFVINFKPEEVMPVVVKDNNSFNYYLVLGIMIPLLAFIVLIFFVYYKNKNGLKNFKSDDVMDIEVENGDLESVQKNLNVGKKEVEIKEEGDIDQDSFDEFVSKHLTENEKEVVKLIKEYEGITQHDILNYLPKLTKSNLSKIISKLHSRKILNRIKVGKVNKIHLGDKLKLKEEKKSSFSEE
jgi:hypothetical protein